MDSPMLFWLCFYGFFLMLSAYVGYRKNNTVAGVLLGYVLGPIGLLLMFLSADRRCAHCPHCGIKVDFKAYFCPHCRQKCYKQLLKDKPRVREAL
ncbi:hypothetical protein HGP28_03865 [Vibrio sp. SM6]|uniref:Zinc ribbon domain-containing protein n=1 Tax=Vibrio agarilyticus TaxID=2726741 RepID=A0A7X8TPV7_9VIBR|nr:hypothetical protein [Vibrio agarilyticus]NLS12028.1 hypothetical protein [Vibrio agarilyticus]